MASNPKFRHVEVWYCCNCDRRDINGNRSSRLAMDTIFCPECAYQRCQYCYTEWVKGGSGWGWGSSPGRPPPLPPTSMPRSAHTSSPRIPPPITELPPAEPPGTELGFARTTRTSMPQFTPTSITELPEGLPAAKPSRVARSSPIAESLPIASLSKLSFKESTLKENPPVPRSSLASIHDGWVHDDYQKTPDNEDSRTLANNRIKKATGQRSSGTTVPDEPMSKSADGSTTVLPADSSGSSLPVVPDKTLGQTSHVPIPEVVDRLPRVLSPLDCFAENPTSYFKDISDLAGRVIDLHTNTLLRIEESRGLSVLQPPSTWPHHIDPSRIEDAMLRTSITDNIKIASAIKSGVKLLAEEGFCSLGYNIIVVDNNRPMVLNILPVSMSSLTVLCDLLHELILKLDSSGLFLDDGTISITNSSSLDILEIMCDVRELLIHIVSTLGLESLESSFEGCSLGTHCDSWIKVCLLLNSTLSILHLSLLTFIRSHLDVTDVTPGGGLSGELVIPALNGFVLMAPRRLKCLNGFVKKPVWAFSSHPRKTDLSTVDFDGFYVSTSIQDFAQLWGPVKVQYIQYRSSGSLQAVSIKTRGGCLQKVTPAESSTSIVPSKDETLCHWIDWLDVENLDTLDNPGSIDVSTRLLIGAYITAKSRRRGRENPSMQLSDYCQHLNKYSFNYDAFELTTRPPSWKLDARTVQVSGGKYITINIGRTYKFDAGWTLKDVIVETWLGSDTTELDPRFSYISPRYLDYLVVLDISCCSGNARRISLWELLNHVNVRDFLRWSLNTDLFRILDNTLERLSPVDPIAENWQELPSSDQELLTSAFRFVLTMLKSTGIRENRILQVWDITSFKRVDGRKIDPRWVTMLEDNDRCATFAIMTTTCFQCQPSPLPNHTGNTQRETVICTQLCIKSRATSQGSTHPESKQEKKQASRAEDSPKDGGGKFSSKWAVVHASNLDINEFVEPARSDQPPGETELLEKLRRRQESRQAVICPSNLATSGFVEPPLNDQAHGERELLEQLLRRQESRQRVSQEVNMSSKRMSTLPQDSSPTPASPTSSLRYFGEVTSELAQQEHCVNASSSTCASKALNRHVMNLDFISGSGKTIGRLILEPSYGPKRSINISRLSDESILTARWEPYDYGHGLLHSIHETEKAWDGRAKTWAQNSNSFLQKIFNLFTPQDDAIDAPLVTENIRLGTSKDGEKVVRSFIR